LSWEWVYPDFTGRQNVFMAAQLLGMSAEEVSGLMPGIEAFAEIGEYIDHPVRVYLQRHAGASGICRGNGAPAGYPDRG
jgi:hypothetical protein